MNDRVLDISRARRELGYAPRVSPQEAIRRTAEWYRNSAVGR
jgi:nucleoside-diphosphate-sugar epimerase